MIEAKGLNLIYQDGTVALKDIDLKIDANEMVYITGPSGSGKTSLLKLFMGDEFPTSGVLTVVGLPLSKSSDSKIRMLRRSIGPVFQDFKLIKGRTALENVMLGMRFIDMSARQIRKNAYEALEKAGLGHKVNSLVDNLSWGERQRTAIARAVARKPSLILADEPTGNLDINNALNILELLKSYRSKDTSVIITTHATHLIENDKTCRHIAMNNGTIAANSLV